MRFDAQELRKGCREGTFEEISRREAYRVVGEGKMVSSSFMVWQGEGEEKRALCGKSKEAEWSLGEGTREDGKAAEILPIAGEGVYVFVMRRKQWVLPLIS